MMKRFKTLFFVKSSLISLYLALTIPIPFISVEELKIFSILLFFFGLFVIFNITSDYVETDDKKILYKANFISKAFGKKNWEILWEEIKSIKNFPTSQGSRVFYFVTNKNENFLVPQRLENFNKFLIIISKKTGLNIKELSYISPLWTYKFLTIISIIMIIGETMAFLS